MFIVTNLITEKCLGEIFLNVKYLILVTVCCAKSISCVPLFETPWDCSLPSSSIHVDSPGKNSGVGCHALLQGIFPTQESNPGLQNCRQILYHLSYQWSASEWLNWTELNWTQWLRLPMQNHVRRTGMCGSANGLHYLGNGWACPSVQWWLLDWILGSQTGTRRAVLTHSCRDSSGWGTDVHSRLIHVNVWQKPLQYCKVISLQLK